MVRVYTELERERGIELRHGKGVFVADSARRLTPGERERKLRRLARQLAVEAVQLDAAPGQVLRMVREELAASVRRSPGRQRTTLSH